ncbi:MAG: DNA repair exonuclease [Butyrivibrio sp.]|nr:DNA repair exonuclease [Butyrivibrio sp.]
MKIIHCADIHLDSQMTANLERKKARERKREILDTFIRMVEYADENSVFAVIIAGDLFDTGNFSAGTRNSVIDAISSHPGIRFYYIMGNHGGGDSFVRSIKELPQNLFLFSRQWHTFILYEGRRSKITLSGIELCKDNMNTVYSSLLLDPGDFNIVTMHGQITAYQAKNSPDNISLADLRNKNIDYLALGHVHEYREGELPPRGRYCYCGCLEGRGFDECGSHGFVLLNIDEESFSYTTQFVDFANRHLHEVIVDISDCRTNTDIRTRIARLLCDRKIKSGDLVKVVLAGDIEVDCEKNTGYLTNQFKDDFYYVRIKDRTRIAVDYSDYELDASLKGEFVRLVKGDDSLSDDEKAQIIRCGFQALNGEEIEL